MFNELEFDCYFHWVARSRSVLNDYEIIKYCVDCRSHKLQPKNQSMKINCWELDHKRRGRRWNGKKKEQLEQWFFWQRYHRVYDFDPVPGVNQLWLIDEVIFFTVSLELWDLLRWPIYIYLSNQLIKPKVSCFTLLPTQHFRNLPF